MSGGSAVESTDAASAVTFTFDGDGVQWIGYRDSGSGIAMVYVDGELAATVDTYSPTILSQTVVFSVAYLKRGPNGTHRITMTVTSTHNAASTPSWVWVDAYEEIG